MGARAATGCASLGQAAGRTAATASISTRAPGGPSPDTNATVIAGGGASCGQTSPNAARPPCTSVPATARIVHFTTSARVPPAASRQVRTLRRLPRLLGDAGADDRAVRADAVLTADEDQVGTGGHADRLGGPRAGVQGLGVDVQRHRHADKSRTGFDLRLVIMTGASRRGAPTRPGGPDRHRSPTSRHAPRNHPDRVGTSASGRQAHLATTCAPVGTYHPRARSTPRASARTALVAPRTQPWPDRPPDHVARPARLTPRSTSPRPRRHCVPTCRTGPAQEAARTCASAAVRLASASPSESSRSTGSVHGA